MRNEVSISGVYEKIYDEMNILSKRPDSWRVFSVDMVLFNYLYHKKKGSLGSYEDFEQHVEILAEHSLEISRKFFCGGKAAIDWFLSFLHKEGMIEDEDWEYLRSGDMEQAEFSLEELKKGNYDLLHGAIGIAYYLLYERGTEFEDYFKEFITELENLCDTSISGMIPNFDMVELKVLPNMVNFGLSHGIPSILKFCIGCYRKGICSTEAEKLAKRIIRYMLDHVREDRTSGRFPAAVIIGHEARDSPSRLAWCYGDLGVAYILYQAGVVFEDRDLVAFSIDTLKTTTKWTNKEASSIRDGGICHGAAGATYIYHKLWMMSMEKEFKDASDWWLEQTLRMAYGNSEASIYMCFNPMNGEFSENYSLLEGTPGIGLVLHSLMTNEFDWDYYLMLN